MGAEADVCIIAVLRLWLWGSGELGLVGTHRVLSPGEIRASLLEPSFALGLRHL